MAASTVFVLDACALLSYVLDEDGSSIIEKALQLLQSGFH